MSGNRFHIFLVSLIALVLAGVFFFGPTALAAEEKDGGTYTGISKDRSCTWWLDESKEVSKEDKAEIKKLFEALETKLEKDGLDSVEFPWKPPKEEEKKAEEEKKEEKELTDEQKKWEEDEWYEDPEVCPGVIIPSKDDINVAKVDGATTGTLFVVRGKFDDLRIEVWRLKLNKEGEDWLVMGREIEHSFEPVYALHQRKKTAYKFKEIRIDHDQMHITLKGGRFYPLYSGNEKIIGGAVFGDGVINFKPPTKLAKDWETDTDVRQLKRNTKEVKGGEGVDELKDVKVTKIAFYLAPANFDRFVKLDGLEKIEVKDRGEFEEAQEIVKGELDWLCGTDWGVKLPFKGRPEGDKNTLPLYYLPEYDELLVSFMYTPTYQWVGYYDFLPTPVEGVQEEIHLYGVQERGLMFGEASRKGGNAWCLYNRPDQRESLTRREAEYEPFEVAKTLDRKVDANIGFKEEPMDAQTPLDEVGLVLGSTAVFGKFRCTTEMEITKSGVTVLPFALGFMATSKGPSTKVTKVLDERGLDILKIAAFTLVFPPLANGQRLSFTAEYEGAAVARLFTTSSYGSLQARWFPNYGYIDCSTFEAILGVPKPNIGVTVGGLVEEWEDGNSSFTHWASSECIRMATICFSDFGREEATFDKPGGGSMKFYYFYHNKLSYTVSEADITDFEDRHRGGGAWGEQGRRTEDDWRGRALFHKLEYTTRDPKSVVDEFESIMKFQQALYLDYPYKKLSAVMMPILTFMGQGFPSLLTLDGTSFISDGDKAQYDWFFRNWGGAGWGAEFWAHEAGHQYWGHVVGWRAWRDQWFSEAFTEQQCAMYVQASRTDFNYVEKLREWRDYALRAIDTAPLTLGQRRVSSRDWYFLTYNKGPYVVHMIRQMVGDTAFIAYTRNLLKSMYWKEPTTSDFQSVLEQTLGEDNMLALFGKDNMQWFFDQWVYGMGVPSYEYGYELSGSTAKVKIKHTGAQFRARIPMWVYPESGEKYAIPVLLTGEKPIEEFDLTLRGPAKKLVLDEFGAVLTKKTKEVKYSKVK